MTKYAVAYTDNWDESLSIAIVEAEDWKHALNMHPHFANGIYSFEENVGWLSDDINIAKDEAINTDMEFDVVEIKE